ncbi:4-(cytidine 5'-diphospho)-2-C-methyl-D-erythritol kinase [Pseudoalteromonas piscicida]|uniref:4-diphosphocytidyl-2-C-methyl-D-erythritol kinase n=1 Tax=Pseudoalteromonas piscicida TaxID=43662 RepID=A0A2A5JNM0_PSEO7|nr:4-(cytidine 5'-diphospho)-2-C-methyl-D-erythritol kinase [Pseudoalteromonas piscicida]PCK31010.1 4-(cytidine 5'-diphospho)-2-C-methyl-D-erythritol kinase [Pseudoalteromonas piscicida]
MKTLTLSAPAKLNLFLHINGRRADGYHELETLFTFLDFGDELTFSLIENSDQITVTGDTSGIPLEDNLIYKAAKLLASYKKINVGVEIHLTKNLPMGGGVGGGSSDAATTLLALNILWRCQLTIEELAKIGLQLGADVPVFVEGKTAVAHGVGEQLEPMDIAQKWYLVVAPPVHVSTALVFTHPDLPRNTPKLENGWKLSETGNDCQTLVKKLYPEVEKTLSWLLKYAPTKMTGTGACCFAEFENREAALRVLESLPSSWQGFIAQNTSESICHRQLRAWQN